MLQTLDLLGFLTLGLLGGLGHCVGMCSPFVLYVGQRFAGDARSWRGRLWPQVLYGLGRLTTYAALGAVAGLLGSAVDLAGDLMGVQRVAAVLAGALLILFAFVTYTDLLPLLSSSGGRLFGRFVAALKRRRPSHPYVLGLALGLLPCGLLYGAVIAAAPSNDAAIGALSLALFGVGTLPAMLGLSFLGDFIRRRRGLLNRAALIFVSLMGLWYMWQGLRVTG